MTQKIHRSITEPIRGELSWEHRWKADDQGLITSWEVGRNLRQQKPDLVARVEQGELPTLDWKGGVEKTIKGEKFGSYYYIAQLQGLRGEDLDIDPSVELQLVCTRTGVKVTYTSVLSKLGNE